MSCNFTFFPLVIVDDLAVDWIGNNLYWTESIYRRVEVLDLDTMNRKVLIQTDTHTAPRAIAVDPINRLVSIFCVSEEQKRKIGLTMPTIAMIYYMPA